MGRTWKGELFLRYISLWYAAKVAGFFCLRAASIFLLGLCFFFCKLLFLLRFGSRRILFAPESIAPVDLSFAEDLYNGRFAFAGQRKVAMGKNIFRLQPLSPAWKKELFSFAWLRHLHAGNLQIFAVCARRLLEDWKELHCWRQPLAYAPAIVACRANAWLTHSPFLLEGADPLFRNRFLRGLDFSLFFLRWSWFLLPRTHERLLCLITLGKAVLCISGWQPLRGAVLRWLDAELEKQILPDGGHISRSPDVLVELLLHLIPLQRAFVACDALPGIALLSAVDRMQSMLRFFCHGDGGLASFNGVSDLRFAEVRAILECDNTHAKPLDSAVHSGYERVSCGGSTVLLDVGKTPPLAVSTTAHAACGAFEFSSGQQRIIVNCGQACLQDDWRWREGTRSTPAHSTVAMGDLSSHRFVRTFLPFPNKSRLLLPGPRDTFTRRIQDREQVAVETIHNAYASQTGFLFRRRILLSKDGTQLIGEDLFQRAPEFPSALNLSFSIRFHVHPSVSTRFVRDDLSILLRLPDGEVWAFVAQGGKVALEESVYFGKGGKMREACQIVIYAHTQECSGMKWIFRCLQEGEEFAA